MLRIARRAGQRIVLGNDVVIEVTEIRGGTVRIGILAPRSLPVYREELWLEVKRENEAAARSGDRALEGLASRLAAAEHQPAEHQPAEHQPAEHQPAEARKAEPRAPS